MTKSRFLYAAIFLLAGCGGEGAATASANEATSTPSDTGPKWVIRIDGLPEQSGKAITAATMGSVGQYGLANSGFTATIRVDPDNHAGHMMLTFNDANARCLNKGEAKAAIEGDRAVVSGQVICMPKSGGDESPATIEGWLTLDQ